jgi:hypothetical protein
VIFLVFLLVTHIRITDDFSMDSTSSRSIYSF